MLFWKYEPIKDPSSEGLLKGKKANTGLRLSTHSRVPEIFFLNYHAKIFVKSTPVSFKHIDDLARLQNTWDLMSQRRPLDPFGHMCL